MACIMDRKILLTAFRGTSAAYLLDGITECDMLLLPSHRIRDSQMLVTALSTKYYDYVVSVGQKPNIRDKVHIETTARNKEFTIETPFNCNLFIKAFQKNGLRARLSHNAGTSFCNRLYLNGLMYIAENNMDTRMVFLHVPYMKNMTEQECFRNRFQKAIWEGVGKYAED